MTKLITSEHKTFLASQFYEAIEEEANTSFYVYVGVHGNVIGDVPTPVDSVQDSIIDVYRNMMFGKRVSIDDVSLVVRYIPWESKVFAMYDSSDDELLEKDFYCVVDEGGLSHIYKCLDNNFGAVSTIEPVYTYVSAESNYMFETSDGYVWKYMYSITSTDRKKFITQNYFPVVTNDNVADNSVKGAIDVIRIEQNDLDIPGGGKKYDNYVTGIFTANQLRINGNNYLYAISNDNISFTEGFYTGCMIYLSGGDGVGQYKTITDYYHNANGNFIGIHSPFAIEPQNGTEFEIYPEVLITGSGRQTVNAAARALVNATGSNSIYKIEILERGADYNYISANVAANNVITDDIAFVAAELHPIYSPELGHGVDSAAELGAINLEISMKFSNSESGTILTENRYQQIGLIKDPTFSNVHVEITNTAGLFLTGEQAYKIVPVRINSNVNITNTSTAITGSSSLLSNASVVSSGTSGSYIPEDILNIEGGTPTTTAQVKVLRTLVRTVTINAAGSGYTPGNFTANLNLGTAVTNAVFTVTANATGNCQTIVITDPGEYTTNPPYLANSTPVGGAGSGLTVNITMGLESVEIFEPGNYAVIPTDLATNNPISNVGDGAGAELLIEFTATLEADFLNQFSVGDFIYITNSEKTLQQLAVVSSITNATYMEIDVNGYFTCTSSYMYTPNIKSTAEIVDAANTSVLVISDVDQEITTGDLLVGLSSGAKAQANTVYRNGEEKNFDTFVQLYKYDISVLSDTFDENEIIYQGASLETATAKGLIHSVVTTEDSTILYTSNQVGQFETGTLLQGANSLAVASLNSSWSPELEFASGDVLYIENIEAVNRANDQTETFQIIIGF